MATDIDPRVLILEDELARVRGEWERAFAAVPPEKLHRASAPGSWTPAQLLWHLAKVERGVARMLERLDGGLGPMATVPPGPSKQTVLTILDKYPFHDRSRRLMAPEGLRPPEQVDLVAEQGRLADGRRQLVDVVREAGPRLSLHRYDHPFFGSFDGWQWTLMIARHEERHILQLAEMLSNTP